jgi:hypothetical protein
MSSREPWQWAPKHLLGELGSFPQLVGSDLYMQVAGLFAYCAKCITPRTSERPLSRVTGKPCPYFGTAPKANTTVLQTEFVYYPSSESHLAVARRLESWAGNQVVRTKVHPRQDASPHQPRIGENAHEAPDALAAHVGASAL